jgi:hypothetical protein
MKWTRQSSVNLASGGPGSWRKPGFSAMKMALQSHKTIGVNAIAITWFVSSEIMVDGRLIDRAYSELYSR